MTQEKSQQNNTKRTSNRYTPAQLKRYTPEQLKEIDEMSKSLVSALNESV